jgi:hypothetical protein
MAPEGEDDDDLREDAAALFGVDLGASQALIDLDGGGGEGAKCVRLLCLLDLFLELGT